MAHGDDLNARAGIHHVPERDHGCHWKINEPRRFVVIMQNLALSQGHHFALFQQSSLVFGG
jgi:hypothetical protein